MLWGHPNVGLIELYVAGLRKHFVGIVVVVGTVVGVFGLDS